MDGVTDHTGPRFHEFFLPALLLAVAVTIWRIRSPELRPARFALGFCAGSFLLISVTKYTGFAHHLVLMYPMPHVLVAAAIASIHRRHVYPIDAGLWENIFTLHEGKLQMQPLFVLSQPLDVLQNSLRDPRAVFLDHVPGRQYLLGSAARLDEIARDIGLHKVPVRTIYDLKGREQMGIFVYR